MFDVYCPRHGSRVLLCSENVLALVNQADGIDLRWRCLCGQTGVRRFSRAFFLGSRDRVPTPQRRS